MKIAIVVSEFNTEITQGLLNGAQKTLLELSGSEVDAQHIFWVPGAFELPLVAKKLAQTRRYDGVICLGAVIKGDTAHFEFVSLGSTLGVLQAMLETEIPISFGVLTTYTDEQAEVRAGNTPMNKGHEAATALIKTLRTLNRI